MKYFFVIAAMFFIASSQALAQTQSQHSTQTSRVEDDIKQIERDWLINPYRTGDLKAYDRIVADDFTITHSNGQVLNKEEKRADIIANRITDPSSPFSIGESQVRVYGDGAVSIGYIIEMKSRVRFKNIYIKRGERWQVVASQLNRIRQ